MVGVPGSVEPNPSSTVAPVPSSTLNPFEQLVKSEEVTNVEMATRTQTLCLLRNCNFRLFPLSLSEYWVSPVISMLRPKTRPDFAEPSQFAAHLPIRKSGARM